MTDFTMYAGIPFTRDIRITDGKNIWASIDDLEVRSQLRKGQSSTSALIANLHLHMTPSFDGNDIMIAWIMTGADVASLRTGDYDVIVSDVGAIDARAIRVLQGKITVKNTVTNAADPT